MMSKEKMTKRKNQRGDKKKKKKQVEQLWDNFTTKSREELQMSKCELFAALTHEKIVTES